MATNDLTLFVDACKSVNQEMSLRGSTAYMLTRSPGAMASGSIVESVPPLADLDVIVHDKDLTTATRRVSDVLERYRMWEPASRFLHVDVFYKHLPVRNDSPLGNVVIEGLPEVKIGPDEQNDTWSPTPAIREVEASVALQAPETLFRDFLFLLRLTQRHDELESATEQVAALLQGQSPTRLGRATRHVGGARELERIDKALVKHVLLRDAERKPISMRTYLPTGWLSRFASHMNGTARTIILGEEYWERTPAIVYLMNGTVMRFAEVRDLDAEEKTLLEKKLPLEEHFEVEPGSTVGGRTVEQSLTPFLEVVLPNPSRPECCEYRDFSKGISELAWSNGERRKLRNVALMEGREKYYAVHAQASEGFGARSLRTDPGFMGILNAGAPVAVRVMGVLE